MAKTKANKRTDFWNWAFESTGRNPLAWQASAKDLLEGAEAVKDRVPAFSGLMPTLASVQALLLGLALECLLKALWIKSHRAWLDKHKEFSLTRNGEYVGIPNVNDHDGRSGALEITILKQSGAVAAQSSARVTGRTPVVRQLAEEEGAARAVR